MTLALAFTRRAQEDMEEIWAYIADDSPAAADRTIGRFMEAAKAVADHPEMGRRRDELAEGLRSFPVGSYVIFYRRRARRVEIYRVLHGARDLGELL